MYDFIFHNEGFDMTVGFVMVKVHSGGELQAFNKLKMVSDVVEIYQIFGEYDLIVKIIADDFESIANIVVHKIRTIDEVLDTKTITGMEI
jgi:DNA-binding Lrp family transcriptional regulator